VDYSIRSNEDCERTVEVMEMSETTQPKLVKCHRCGYEWWTRSRLIFATCPSCFAKVRVRELPKKAVENE